MMIATSCSYPSTALHMIHPQALNPSLLLVDDDATFCQVRSGALARRGFVVTVAHSVEQARPLLET